MAHTRCEQTDGRTDRQTWVIPIYPPHFVCEGILVYIPQLCLWVINILHYTVNTSVLTNE